MVQEFDKRHANISHNDEHLHEGYPDLQPSGEAQSRVWSMSFWTVLGAVVESALEDAA